MNTIFLNLAKKIRRYLINQYNPDYYNLEIDDILNWMKNMDEDELFNDTIEDLGAWYMGA